MRVLSKKSCAYTLLTLAVTTAAGGLSAQAPDAAERSPDRSIVINGRNDPAGPEIKGVIASHSGDTIKVAGEDGSKTVIAITDGTEIKASNSIFATPRAKPTADALVNGLYVTVQTIRSADAGAGDSLVARQIKFRVKDERTASMIRNGTSERFDQQAAATEALRGRIGDIDKYNVKSTTNVHFAVGKAELSPQDKADLCTTATTAQATENALLLVVGYTDSTGGDEINQQLSERRAARVINYLQQTCGWKPYRMLTPTGMAKADPAASNDTPEGKAQNRRVAVNVLVSKSVDGM